MNLEANCLSFAKLFQSCEKSDVDVVIKYRTSDGENATHGFPGHAAIITSWSKTLDGQWKWMDTESHSHDHPRPGRRELVVNVAEESDMEAVVEMVRVMYHNQISAAVLQDHAKLVKLLMSADFYEAPRIVELCWEALEKLLDKPDVMLSLLEMGTWSNASNYRQKYNRLVESCKGQLMSLVRDINRHYTQLLEDEEPLDVEHIPWDQPAPEPVSQNPGYLPYQPPEKDQQWQHLMSMFGDVKRLIGMPVLHKPFLALTFPAIQVWAGSDELVVESEDWVVMLLNAWWEHAAGSDKSPSNMQQLSCLVRMMHLSTGYLHGVLPQLPWFGVVDSNPFNNKAADVMRPFQVIYMLRQCHYQHQQQHQQRHKQHQQHQGNAMELPADLQLLVPPAWYGPPRSCLPSCTSPLSHTSTSAPHTTPSRGRVSSSGVSSPAAPQGPPSTSWYLEIPLDALQSLIDQASTSGSSEDFDLTDTVWSARYMHGGYSWLCTLGLRACQMPVDILLEVCPSYGCPGLSSSFPPPLLVTFGIQLHYQKPSVERLELERLHVGGAPALSTSCIIQAATDDVLLKEVAVGPVVCTQQCSHYGRSTSHERPIGRSVPVFERVCSTDDVRKYTIDGVLKLMITITGLM